MSPVRSLVLVVALAVGGCGGSSTPATTPYPLQTPTHFPALDVPASNPTTVEGVALGRRLYYDPILSNDGRSCAQCHLQQHGFTTPGTNVLPHVNLGWSRHFLWKGGKTGTLEDVMEFEVVEFFQADLSRLAAHDTYPELFRKAFGSGGITGRNAGRAVAQFVRTMISAESKFDRYLRGEEQLSSEEHLGFLIFNTEKGDCFHCHAPPLTTDNAFHNIGLEATPAGENEGRITVTGNAADLGKFKTPSLRNIALRQSYMHDGRFTTLEEVVDHYDSGVKRSPTVDPIMTKPGKEFGLRLSAAEKAALVAFLKTMSDPNFVADPRFETPFTP